MLPARKLLSECTPDEIENICTQNCRLLEVIFASCIQHCTNCGYPLTSLVKPFYSLYAGGSICELCHAMEAAVGQWEFFRHEHLKWNEAEKAKKKMLDNNHYL